MKDDPLRRKIQAELRQLRRAPGMFGMERMATSAMLTDVVGRGSVERAYGALIDALIWAWVCQVCRGERTPCPSASASARSGRVRWWRACRVRRVVTLICAGWIPHDGLFGGAFTRV